MHPRSAFAVRGLGAVRVLASGTAPWALLMLAILAQGYMQAGFQRANAASVTAAMSTAATSGPILAGFFLYHETVPSYPASLVLAAGLGAAIAGTALLSGIEGRLAHSSALPT